MYCCFHFPQNLNVSFIGKSGAQKACLPQHPFLFVPKMSKLSEGTSLLESEKNESVLKSRKCSSLLIGIVSWDFYT